MEESCQRFSIRVDCLNLSELLVLRPMMILELTQARLSMESHCKACTLYLRKLC